MEESKMPVGFGLALAMAPDALRNFAIMPQEQKNKVIEKARQSESREETRSLLIQLAKGTFT